MKSIFSAMQHLDLCRMSCCHVVGVVLLVVVAAVVFIHRLIRLKWAEFWESLRCPDLIGAVVHIATIWSHLMHKGNCAPHQPTALQHIHGSKLHGVLGLEVPSVPCLESGETLGPKLPSSTQSQIAPIRLLPGLQPAEPPSGIP